MSVHTHLRFRWFGECDDLQIFHFNNNNMTRCDTKRSHRVYIWQKGEEKENIIQSHSSYYCHRNGCDGFL